MPEAHYYNVIMGFWQYAFYRISIFYYLCIKYLR